MSVADALCHPQIADRGMIGSFENAPGVGRDIHIARTGVKIDGKAPITDTPPPTLGQDTEAILLEIGYSDTEIARLREENAI
jgi:crotonobetainyl-CoA:carnitine CoA-transferase CaiB-like acyl-CoA transferase